MPSPRHAEQTLIIPDAVDGQHLRFLADSFPLVRYSHNDPKLRELIPELSAITIEQMERMNRAHPGLPPDTLEKTTELTTTKGASTFIMRGIFPGEEDKGPQVIAYGNAIEGRENILDIDHIPDVLKQDPRVCRVQRLFISEKAREVHDSASEILLNAIFEWAAGKDLIPMILTDITLLDAPPGNYSKDVWLIAGRMLAKKGVETVCKGPDELITHPNGTKVIVHFDWGVYPPKDPNLITTLKRRQSDFRNLDKSKWGRLAWTASALPAEGGTFLYSGRASHAHNLAQVHSGNSIIAARHSSPEVGPKGEDRKWVNLTYINSNDTGRYTPDKSVDGAVCYGVLPDYARRGKKAVYEFINNQAAQLKEGASLIIRDTLRHRGPHNVKIVLSTEGVDAGIPSASSSFREFIRSPLEPHLKRSDLDAVITVETGSPHLSSFIAPLTVVAEWRAKWPFHAKWGTERKRPYTMMTVEDIERRVARSGLRLILSIPEISAWENERYYQNHMIIENLAGNELGPLPTGHVIIAEKVSPTEGVQIRSKNVRLVETPTFVKLQKFKAMNPDGSETVQEVGSREGITKDIVPFFEHLGELYVEGRMMPRPLLAVDIHPLDGSKNGAYQPEQLAVISTTPGFSVEEFLSERAGINPEDIISESVSSPYFVRPEAITEVVVPHAVEIKEQFGDRKLSDNPYKLATAPTRRTLNAKLILAGCQNGSIQDPRLERVIYELMNERKLEKGIWLGETTTLRPQALPFDVSEVLEVLSRESATRFVELPKIPKQKNLFFEVKTADFEEKNANGETIGTADPEFLTPSSDTGLSSHSISTLLAIRDQETGQILVGIERREFAAVQLQNGDPSLATIPTYRIPAEIKDLNAAKLWVTEKLYEHSSIRVSQINSLGGKYRSSPGIMTDLVYPHIVEVDADAAKSPGLSNFDWVPLEDLEHYSHKIQCGQLRTSCHRAAHMFESAESIS